MTTLVLHITLNEGHDSESLYSLLSKADCVADYEFIDEFANDEDSDEDIEEENEEA
jgi:hypothetical protein